MTGGTPAAKAFLSAQLPGGPANGLPAVVPQLVAQFLGSRRDVIYAVVQLKAGSAEVDRHTEELVPTARVLAIEPLVDVDDVGRARDLLRTARQRRTGIQEPLFDI